MLSSKQAAFTHFIVFLLISVVAFIFTFFLGYEVTLRSEDSELSSWWSCFQPFSGPRLTTISEVQRVYLQPRDDQQEASLRELTSSWSVGRRVAATKSARCATLLLTYIQNETTSSNFTAAVEGQDLGFVSTTLLNVCDLASASQFATFPSSLAQLYATVLSNGSTNFDGGDSAHILLGTSAESNILSDLVGCTAAASIITFSASPQFLTTGEFTFSLGHCPGDVDIDVSEKDATESRQSAIAVELTWKPSQAGSLSHLRFLYAVGSGVSLAQQTNTTSSALNSALWSLLSQDSSSESLSEQASPRCNPRLTLSDTTLGNGMISVAVSSVKTDISMVALLLSAIVIVIIGAVVIKLAGSSQDEEETASASHTYRKTGGVESSSGPNHHAAEEEEVAAADSASAKSHNDDDDDDYFGGDDSDDGPAVGSAGGASDDDGRGGRGGGGGMDDDEASFLAPERSTVANAEDLRFSCGLTAVGGGGAKSPTTPRASGSMGITPPPTCVVLTASFAHYSSLLDEHPNVAEAQLRLLASESKDIIKRATTAVSKAMKCLGMTAEVYLRHHDVTLVAIFHGGSDASYGRLEAALKSATKLRQLVQSKKSVWSGMMVQESTVNQQQEREAARGESMEAQNQAASESVSDSITQSFDTPSDQQHGLSPHTPPHTASASYPLDQSPTEIHYAELSFSIALGPVTIAQHGSEVQTTSAHGPALDSALQFKELHSHINYPGIMVSSEVAALISSFHVLQSKQQDAASNNGDSLLAAELQRALKVPIHSTTSLGHFCAVPIDAAVVEDGISTALTAASAPPKKANANKRESSTQEEARAKPSPPVGGVKNKTVVIYELLEVDHQAAAAAGFIPSSAKSNKSGSATGVDITVSSSSFNGLSPSDVLAVGALCRSLGKMLNFSQVANAVLANASSQNQGLAAGTTQVAQASLKLKDAVNILQDAKELLFQAKAGERMASSSSLPQTTNTGGPDEALGDLIVSSLCVSGLGFTEKDEDTALAIQQQLHPNPLNGGSGGIIIGSPGAGTTSHNPQADISGSSILMPPPLPPKPSRSHSSTTTGGDDPSPSIPMPGAVQTEESIVDEPEEQLISLSIPAMPQEETTTTSVTGRGAKGGSASNSSVAKTNYLIQCFADGNSIVQTNAALLATYRKYSPLAVHIDRLLLVAQKLLKRIQPILAVPVPSVSASAGLDASGRATSSHDGSSGDRSGAVAGTPLSGSESTQKQSPTGAAVSGSSTSTKITTLPWPRQRNGWETFKNDLLERRAGAWDAIRNFQKQGGGSAGDGEAATTALSKEKAAQLFRATTEDGQEMLVELKCRVEERVAKEQELERIKQEKLEERARKAEEEAAAKADEEASNGSGGGGFALFNFMPTSDNDNSDADSCANEEAQKEEEVLEEEPREFTDRRGNVWRRSNRSLGKGAFGSVFLGMGASGNLVAIKAMSIKKIDLSECEAVTKEVALLTRLRHENVVEYLSSVIVGNYFMIVMEAIGGGSLFQTFVQYTKLNEATLRRYLLDILSGLRYLHMNGVLHRDIKPHNVLLTANGQCKLADFGTASFLGQRNALVAGDIQGTILYMAPEACVGNTHPRSDIWSVGIMTYYLATGEYPWHKSDVQLPHIILNRLGKDPTYRPNLDLLTLGSPIRNFVQSCLRMEPELRPSADDLMKDPFMVAVPRDQDDEDFYLTQAGIL